MPESPLLDRSRPPATWVSLWRRAGWPRIDRTALLPTDDEQREIVGRLGGAAKPCDILRDGVDDRGGRLPGEADEEIAEALLAVEAAVGGPSLGDAVGMAHERVAGPERNGHGGSTKVGHHPD